MASIDLANINFCPGGGESSEKIEDTVEVTLTENNTYNVYPSEGYDAVRSVGVTVDVPLSEKTRKNIPGTVEWFETKSKQTIWNYSSVQDFTDNINYAYFDSSVGGLIYNQNGITNKYYNGSSWVNCSSDTGDTVKTKLWADYRQLSTSLQEAVKIGDYPNNLAIIGVGQSINMYNYYYSQSYSEVNYDCKVAGWPVAYAISENASDDEILQLNQFLSDKIFSFDLTGWNAVWNNYYSKVLKGMKVNDIVINWNNNNIPFTQMIFNLTSSSEPAMFTVRYPKYTSVAQINIDFGSYIKPRLSGLPSFVTDTRNFSFAGSSLAYAFAGCSNLKKISNTYKQQIFTGIKYADGCFYGCFSLDNIDNMVFPDVETVGLDYGMFENTGITHIKTSSFPNGVGVRASRMFLFCNKLTSIEKLDVSKINNDSQISKIIGDNPSLTTLGGFTGLKVNLDISSVKTLTHDSLLNVINEAADVTASPKTLTLGSTNLAKLSDEEKAIATGKGWTLA